MTSSSLGRRGQLLAGALGLALAGCSTQPDIPKPFGPTMIMKYGGPPMSLEQSDADSWSYAEFREDPS